jgi:hypothetical protein
LPSACSQPANRGPVGKPRASPWSYAHSAWKP